MPPRLARAAVRAATTRRYTQCLRRFRDWARGSRGTRVRWRKAVSGSGSTMDGLLSTYFQLGFEGKVDVGGRSGAAATLCAVADRWPALRGALWVARRSLKAWLRKSRPQRWAPLTLELTATLAVAMAARGHSRAAIGTMLAFDCMLRVSELCRLRARDIADEHKGGIGAGFAGMGVSLRRTKTGPDKYVEVDRADVRGLVSELLPTLRPQDRLVGLTTSGYRAVFKQACADLGVAGVGFVPHSLRHGGATHMFVVLKAPLEAVVLRGRWAAKASAHHYIQAGVPRMLRARLALLGHLQDRGARVLKSISVALRAACPRL